MTRYLVGLLGTVALTALPALAAPTASAQADTDSVVVSQGQLEVAPRNELRSRLADLEVAYQKANVRKPRAGVAVSAVLLTAGVGVLVAGVALGSDFGGDDPLAGPLIGVGSATIVLSAGGLAFSGVRLKRAKRERQRLTPEIESLRSAMDSAD